MSAVLARPVIVRQSDIATLLPRAVLPTPGLPTGCTITRTPNGYVVRDADGRSYAHSATVRWAVQYARQGTRPVSYQC